MPTYEYACTACGERTEAKKRFDDPPLETCELCGGKLRKLFSPVGIVFKGSGFYSSDAKRKSEAKAKGKSDSSDASKEPAGSTSSEGTKVEKKKVKETSSTPAASEKTS